ncbi:MAG: response regulator, partial [Planctomycetota bacterium]
GEQGLRELESDGNDIDVALVDWNMPGMDGLAMTERVRANPETKDKKIVMVSTECEPRRIAKALLAGVDEYVMKPFTEDILSDKLELIGAPVQR